MPTPTAETAADSPPTTALAALAAKAASVPEEPWLFYRQGWDWRWRSFGQAADQVARGAAALGDAPSVLGFRSRQDADAVAVVLAIQAAGRDADLASPPPTIPDCRSHLEEGPPRLLSPGDASPATLTLAAGSAPATPAEIFREAGRFDTGLPSVRERWILCATPALTPRGLQVVLAWTLLAGAAWVLEPDSEAFHETVLWARPSIVVATAAELGRLSAALKDRRHRRHSRLRVTIDVADLTAPG